MQLLNCPFSLKEMTSPFLQEKTLLFNPVLVSVLKTQCAREPFENLFSVPASQEIDALAG